MVVTQSKEITFISLAVCAVAVAVGGIAWYLKSKKKFVGKLSKINIYPLKSGPPLAITEAECTEAGLKFKGLRDRQFILTGATKFMTQTDCLKLMNLELQYDESINSMIASAPEMPDLNISLEIPPYQPDQVRDLKWYDGEDVAFMDYGDQYAQWFTKFLGESCRLGYFHPQLPKRKINPIRTVNQGKLHPENKNFFNNTHPYLMCSQASLDDLNSRVEETITFAAFRPNFVVETAGDVQPYEEDKWRVIDLGAEARVFTERACVRCPRIYLDHDNQVPRANKEPMTTLLKYRRGEAKRDKSKTVFGINLSTVKCGVIRLNDPIYATCA